MWEGNIEHRRVVKRWTNAAGVEVVDAESFDAMTRLYTEENEERARLAKQLEGAVEALRQLFEASQPYDPKVRGVNAEDDRLSAARESAGHHLRGQ